MQEAPNSYEKDEQQERGNYDSANYMEGQTGLSWVAPKERFDSSMVKLWFESTALRYYKYFIK